LRGCSGGSVNRHPAVPNGPVGSLVLLAALLAMACRDGPTAPDVEPVYLLPFPVGDSARVIQGNHGTFTHFGHAAYAFDFRMTIGRVVTAMRAGQVIAIEERYIDGNRTPGQENLVLCAMTMGRSGATTISRRTAHGWRWGSASWRVTRSVSAGTPGIARLRTCMSMSRVAASHGDVRRSGFALTTPEPIRSWRGPFTTPDSPWVWLRSTAATHSQTAE